ncbi:DUF4232 domain-containing protein [Streptomyces sp. NBC_01537]|uniref:DUF4232 domain-containing protein n=1 Tax=Streptomyces sp. NBC_01537 TaxID=2903896 RepID=UPI003870E869
MTSLPIFSGGRATRIAGAAALLGLLTACGNGSGSPATAPRTLPGTAQPATGDRTGTPTPTAPTAPTAPVSSAAASTAPAVTGTAGTTRCHTTELRASVGANDPGAGQENFPIVLTNTSQRTCTLYGYPGAAFIDSSGRQVGPDPKRSSAGPTTVTLAPDGSAWAGLTFSNPEISGAKTATPASLLITPPDELSQLKVKWTQGAVPVSGNASSVHLTVFQAGTGS